MVSSTDISGNKLKFLRDILNGVQYPLLEHNFRVKVHHEEALKHYTAVEKELGPLVCNSSCE